MADAIVAATTVPSFVSCQRSRLSSENIYEATKDIRKKAAGGIQSPVNMKEASTVVLLGEMTPPELRYEKAKF